MAFAGSASPGGFDRGIQGQQIGLERDVLDEAHDIADLPRRAFDHVHGGDRLPWAGKSGIDNFAPLRSLDWQLHIYGDIDPSVEPLDPLEGEVFG